MFLYCVGGSVQGLGKETWKTVLKHFICFAFAFWFLFPQIMVSCMKFVKLCKADLYFVGLNLRKK